MWFMNKIVNPFVRLILRSPLHRLLSAALLLITYQGRKSGKAYTLPVQYAQAGQTIYIVPGAPEQKTWWRNLKGGAPVRVTLRGQTLTGTGRLLDPRTEMEAILEGFGQYLRRFPALTQYHSIHVEADQSFNADDLRQAAANLVIIRVDLP